MTPPRSDLGRRASDRGAAFAFSLLACATSLACACRERAEPLRPSPEADALATHVRAPTSKPECLRVSTCGQWAGCAVARPQALPFTPKGASSAITSGRWYRIDVADRRDALAQRSELCVGDAGACHEALIEVIACLPYFNPVEPTYHCDFVKGACARVEERPSPR